MRKPLITKESLKKLYVEEERPINDCAEFLGVSVGAVFNYLKRYEISTRKTLTDKSRLKMSESQKRRPHRSGFKMSEETKRKLAQANLGKYKKPTEFGGHKKKRTDGYITIYCPKHPFATKDGYVMEHILIMERAIGRYITREEVVHHKNHIRTDNRLENLELMTFKAHSGLHMKERWLKRKENIA